MKVRVLGVLLLSSFLFGFADPTEEQTMKFIAKMINKAHFNGVDGAGNRKAVAYSVTENNIHDLTMTVVETTTIFEGMLKGVSKNRMHLNLNFIKEVGKEKLDEDLFKVSLVFFVEYKYEYVRDSNPYAVDVRFENGMTQTGTHTSFIFMDKTSAERLHKSLLHIKELTGVEDDLFDE